MIRITEPSNGAVLNRRHGSVSSAGLAVTVHGVAPLGHSVAVNGAQARRAGETFAAELVLRDVETEIVAAFRGARGSGEHRIRVVWDRSSFPRYRFSIDDNSFFLRDVAAKRYRSLFDCPYLQTLRDLNARYGAKFVLNVFFTTPEKDFTLDRFPASYRGEWADNAGWLRLAFHAYSEFPDRPYQYAPADKLAADHDLVAAEILRFAGETTLTPPTVIHWGMLPETSLPVLFARGVRALSGFFVPLAGGGYVADDSGSSAPGRVYDVNYLMDEERSEYLTRHDALKDFGSGIVFSRVDIVCNNTPVERVVPTLEPLTREPDTAEIMDLFTHEQYFWPFYRNHRPDHAARCEAAIRFCTEGGYKPVFLHEGLLGAT